MVQDTFERLIANLAGAKPRRAVLNGRSYLVAPATLIVPGVLNGSRGPLLYKPDLVERKAPTWNGIPIVVRHPKDDNGRHVSAKAPGILDKVGIGFLFESTWNVIKTGTDGAMDDGRSFSVPGKHASELWFDEEATRNFDLKNNTRILASVESGSPIELSTGLFTAEDEAPANSTWNGKPYTHIVVDYTPDHLAILPDEVGACSIRDGCGVFNENGDETDEDKSTVSKFFGWLLRNAGRFGNPQSTATGRYKPTASGTGKGEVHEAAQRGSLVLTDRDRELGAADPATWAVDGMKWERAKMESEKGDWGDDALAAAANIYRNMGGTIKRATGNEDYKCPKCESESKDCECKTKKDTDMPHAENSFCATGDGGGIDPTCSPGESKGKGGKGTEGDKGKKKKKELEQDEDTLIVKSGDNKGLSIFDPPSGKNYRRLGDESAARYRYSQRADVHIKAAYNGEPNMTRNEAIAELTTNCDCWKDPKDKEVLNTFSDEKLERLMTALRRSQEQEAVVNAVGELAVNAGAPEGMTANEFPDFLKKKIKADPDDDDDDEDDAPPKKGKKMTGNENQPAPAPKKRTIAEWEHETFNNAPAEAKAIWNSAKRMEREGRERVSRRLQQIADSTHDERKKALIANKLKANLPYDALEEVLILVDNETITDNQETQVGDGYGGAFGNIPPAGAAYVPQYGQRPVINYTGNGGGAANLTDNEEILDMDAAREQYEKELAGNKT